MKPRALTLTLILAVSLSPAVVSISYADTYTQNFDGFADGTIDLGDGTVMAGTAVVQGEQLELTRDGVAGGFASFSIPAIPNSTAGWTASFHLTIIDGVADNEPADGMSLNYGNAPLGELGLAEEGMAPNIASENLSFEIDTWMNTDAEQGVNISGNSGGIDLGQLAFTNGSILADGTTVEGDVTIVYDPLAGASFTTTGLLTNADFSNVATGAFVADDNHTFILSARVGGANETILIDDLMIETGEPTDTDGDGLSDFYEIANNLDPDDNGLNPNNNGLVGDPDQGAAGDPDGDTLTNTEERDLRTDPQDSDTDNDNLTDNVETLTGEWNGLDDTGTSPTDADTDNDGLEDGVENPDLAFVDGNQPGTDPNDPDSDGDGFQDGTEIVAGTDPTDPNDFPSTPINLGTGTAALLNNDPSFPLRDLTDPENDGDPENDIGYNAVFNSSEEMGFGGGEFAYNVFDNILGPGNDKWCCGNNGFPYWVEATWETPYVLTNFTISSANDVPDRDPTVWEIQGSNDGVNYETIYRQDDPTVPIWTQRFEVFRFDAGIHYAVPPAYTTIRFECESTRLTAGAMYQLGELEFFGTEGGAQFQIVEIITAPDLSIVNLEFSSFEGRFYSIDRSRDMTTWSELEDGVEGEDGMTEYADIFPVPDDGNPVFYRVRQNE